MRSRPGLCGGTYGCQQYGDFLITALMDTSNKLGIPTKITVEDFKREKGQSEDLRMGLKSMKIHWKPREKCLGSRRHGISVPAYSTAARTLNQGVRGGV